jgi:cellobiose phosphorylase
LLKDLRTKGYWIFDHIRNTEKVTVNQDGQDYSWFNGYYDNKAEKVEGQKEDRIRMTLTGQVFPVMSGLADKDDVTDVIKSVEKFLKDKKLGGYKLNTDFGVSHYLDLGRAFGFAYGTKENGAFFSHMIVMYAYGLYKRNFVHAGYEVLKSLYDMCIDTQKSKIYPGIPEYMDLEGKGMYHYLTGSASWFILTELTQVFGVKGDKGDLMIAPKIVAQQFSRKEQISITCKFAAKTLEVCYINKKGLDFGDYKIKDILLNNERVSFHENADLSVKITKQDISNWPENARIFVYLDKK